MKSSTLRKIKRNEKEVFTKKESKVTIRKNYNPLKVNYKIYRRRSGSYSMKNEILKEIGEELNWKGKIFIHMFSNLSIKIYKKGISFGYNNK